LAPSDPETSILAPSILAPSVLAPSVLAPSVPAPSTLPPIIPGSDPCNDDTLEADGLPATKIRSYWQSVGYRLRHDPVTMIFGTIVLLVVLAAIFAPLLAPFDPYKDSIVGRLKPIGWRGHPLGTDELGRDMLSRLIYGGRISLMMGLLPVLVATAIGGTLGVIAGFGGRRLNTAIMRTMDVFYAFPSILLAVAVSGAMGGGIINGIISLSLVFIPALCRVAETATAQVRGLDFIEAARASGAGTFAIIRYHVLGNVLGPVFIYASSLVSVSILLASGLSFLGLGVRPPEPDWGLMLSTLRQSIYVQPLVCAMPGAAIFVTSICFNLVSDGIRAAMDVRL
jgi:peptide/nickel transport system permease protein